MTYKNSQLAVRQVVAKSTESAGLLFDSFWLCCSFFIKLTTCHATNAVILDPFQANQPLNALQFFNPLQMFLLRDKLITNSPLARPPRSLRHNFWRQILPIKIIKCPPDSQRSRNSNPKPSLKRETKANANPNLKKKDVLCFDLTEHHVTFIKIK